MAEGTGYSVISPSVVIPSDVADGLRKPERAIRPNRDPVSAPSFLADNLNVTSFRQETL
jgi:hypothetical protein